jgi:SAM-dependent methyltransferase
LDRKTHWEGAYQRSEPDRVGWFRPVLDASLALIRHANPAPDDPILDVGGGASTLVDHLLESGFTAVTVLDIAQPAVDVARARLGPAADQVSWIVGDALRTDLGSTTFALWHDRAVFHFLLEEADRERYRQQLLGALRPGGHVVLGAFSAAAPDRCSGLPVRRTSPEQIAADLGPEFRLVERMSEDHSTPGGTEQPYVYVLLERLA